MPGPVVTAERLSALDASFLAVDSPSAPMHVGWVAVFDPPEGAPRPAFRELFAHVARRLERAPRYRQKLAGVPLGLHEPVWVDDPGFDAAEHLLRADGADLDALVDTILSSPLERDRPLWQMWIADELPDGRLALIGKMHHCMVDGTAVVELGRLLLDREPDAPSRNGDDGAAWSPAPAPSPGERLARAVVDYAADGVALGLAPIRLAGSPSRLRALPGAAARTLAHTLLPPAPSSPLNGPGAAQRHHVRVTRSLDDLRTVRRRFRVTPNDVVLAACAGALRRFAERRGEPPQPLKVMVPADVRSSGDAAASGNRISFLFIELPCDEPDPVTRLQAINRATAQRRHDGQAEHLDAAFRTLALTPRPVQRVLAHAFAHPRLFNLTISSVPGPAVPRYLRGCRLREVHSAVPLARRHALSIGVVMVARQVCFGIYADSVTLPDADALGSDLDGAIDELLDAR
ncbi:MAG TPA: wax ester/triacylglycerol synthase family O-acyltransferase [Solirubrobacteraceae bacterium]|nr:wax ester/triacylglycerol synthase family O-acyltransferase [Solirubrobacteraceae bacterium]